MTARLVSSIAALALLLGSAEGAASFALAGDLAPVPEPATLPLLGSTLVGLGIRVRRRR